MRCKECKWGLEFNRDGAITHDMDGKRRYECHVNPPNIQGVWPIILEDDFCGSWEQKK